MGSATSNTAKIKQNISNDFLSLNDNNCYATNNQSVSGNVMNVGKDADNITAFNISGTISSACTINQQITQTLTSILTSQSDQVAKTNSDLFNGGALYSGAHNSTTVNQTIANNITSITANTCNAIVKSEIAYNTMNVAGNAKNVNAFNINTNQTATCTINNTVDQEAYNSVQSKVQNSATSIGMMSSIFTTMAIAAAICIVGLVLIYGVIGITKSSAAKKEKEEKNQPYQPNPYGQPSPYGPYNPYEQQYQPYQLSPYEEPMQPYE